MGSWKEQESKETAEREGCSGGWKLRMRGEEGKRWRGKQWYRWEKVDRGRIENGLCIWRSLAFLVSDFVSTSGVELRGLCWLGEMTRELETFPLLFPSLSLSFSFSAPPPVPSVTLLQSSHTTASMRFDAILIWCSTVDLLRTGTNERSCCSTCTIQTDFGFYSIVIVLGTIVYNSELHIYLLYNAQNHVQTSRTRNTEYCVQKNILLFIVKILVYFCSFNVNSISYIRKIR